MKNLHAYVKLLSKTIDNDAEMARRLGEESGLLYQLFVKLQNCETISEEVEAGIVRELYGDNAAKSAGAYKTLKSRLMDKLQKLLLMLPETNPDLSPQLRKVLVLDRNWAIIKMLQRMQKIDLALDLSSETLKLALEQKRPEHIVNNAQLVSVLYSKVYGNQKYYNNKAKKAEALHRQYLPIRELEEEVTYEYEKWTRLLTDSMAIDIPIGTGIRDSVVAMKRKMNNLSEPVPQIQRTIGVLEVYGYQLLGQFEEALLACDAHLKVLLGLGKSVSPAMLVNFYNLKTGLFLQMRNLEQALESLQESERRQTGDVSWFNAMFLRVRYWVQLGEIDNAYELLLKGQNHPQYSRLHPKAKGEILIFSELLLVIKNRKMANFDFTFQSFLINVEEHWSDRKGMRLNIALIEILAALLKEDYIKHVPHILDRYEFRIARIRNEENPRIRNFYRMLLALEHCDFKPKDVRNKVKRLFDQMSRYDIQQTEMLPYESAWEFILEILENKV